jgi:uncharacterized membrane protein YjgN (DUF898 family)
MALQTADTTAAAAPQRLVYDGRLGELYGIFFLNLLLGIITLGIYRFWGRTRYRRYLWSHTSYDSDRFEYTGTGGELFRGFIIAFGIFFVVILGLNLLQLLVGEEHPEIIIIVQIPFLLLLVFLLFASRYTALRYRLTRTLWRGIRGGLSGSAISYAWRSIGYGILTGLTFYQFVPFATVRLWRYRLNNLFFGTAQASFEGRGRDLYGRYVLAFLLSIGAGIIIVGGIALSMSSVFQEMFEAIARAQAQAQGEAPPPDAEQGPMDGGNASAIQWAIIALVGGYFAWIIVGAIAYLWYWAFSIRYLTGRTGLAGLQFESSVTAGRLFGLIIGNFLLMAVTFGIAYPIVLQRIWRFGSDNFVVHGRVDGAVIEQSRLAPPRMGEGWLEVLDPGIV